MSLPTLSLPRAELLAALAKPAAAVLAIPKSKERIDLNPRCCVWCDGGRHGLRLSATDGTVDARTLLPAAWPSSPFHFGVPGRKLFDLITRLPEGNISLTFDAEGEKLAVKAGRSRASLPTLSERLAPELEAPPEAGGLACDGRRLAAAIYTVAPSADDDETTNRDQVRFIPCAQGLRVEAFKGHEFVRLTLPTPSPGMADPATVWLPVFDASCGVEARRIFSLHKWIETAKHLSASPKRLFFVEGNSWWSLPLRRGDWTETDVFVARLGDPLATVDIATETLMAAADRLAIYLEEKVLAMCLELGHGGAWLSLDGLRGLEPLADAFEGAPGRLLVPGKALAAFCRRAPSPRVRLSITGNETPLGIHALSDDGTIKPGYVGVIMPMNVSDKAYVSVEEAA